jgi:Xaa-Pro aminopeptidase
MTDRIAALQQDISQRGLDALFVTEAGNRRYVSGFTGSNGIVIVGPDVLSLATDFRYHDQVRQQAPRFVLVDLGVDQDKGLATYVAQEGLERIGFDGAYVTVDQLERWRKAMPDVTFESASGMVEALRRVKDADEIARIRAAVELADQAMAHIMDWIQPGVTERQVAWELEVYMRTHGAEKLSFDTIVGSGVNGARPHAVVSERVIERGDPLVIDMGALLDGYCSDLTRSFCVGEARDAYLEAWHLVLEAQTAAEDAIRAGMAGREADAIAREIIYNGGYEGKFGHGLGHGVGLAIHEGPSVSQRSQDTLEAGNVVTVEPGVYDPAWGGIRLEDVVVVHENGCEVLTRVPKVPVVGG